MRTIVFALLLAGFGWAQSSPDDFDEAFTHWAAAAGPGFSLQLERISGPVVTEGELVVVQLSYETPYRQRWDAPLLQSAMNLPDS